MCGIYFACKDSNIKDQISCSPDTLRLLSNRGPDALERVTLSFEETHFIEACNTVLHLRGNSTVSQPLLNNRWMFQWNGEVFDGITVAVDQNDTMVLFAHICQIEDENSEEEAVLRLISSVRGPFAFVLFNVINYLFNSTFLFFLDTFRSSLVRPRHFGKKESIDSPGQLKHPVMFCCASRSDE